MHHFSQHFLEQIKIRNIIMNDVMDTLNNPQNTVPEDGLTVYQKLILINNKQYLLRIFVNETQHPPVAVTGYITSKINKYLPL